MRLGISESGVGADAILQGGDATDETGGDIRIVSGYSRKTTSGLVIIETANSGSNGASGLSLIHI